MSIEPHKMNKCSPSRKGEQKDTLLPPNYSKKELLKLLILETIYQHQQKQRSGVVGESIYGADLIEQLRRKFTVNGVETIKVAPNNIYPLLNELAEAHTQILKSWWLDEAHTKRRRKRYYALTERGYQEYVKLKMEQRELLQNALILLNRLVSELYPPSGTKEMCLREESLDRLAEEKPSET